MKYLKSYKIFESRPNRSFFDEVDDILRPIQDDGFYVEIHKNNGSDERMESDGEYVRIYIEYPTDVEEDNPNVERNFFTKPYTPTDSFVTSIDHLLSYSLDKGYGFSIELVYQSKSVAYEEYPDNEMSIEGVLDITNKAPIDYIRIVIEDISESHFDDINDLTNEAYVHPFNPSSDKEGRKDQILIDFAKFIIMQDREHAENEFSHPTVELAFEYFSAKQILETLFGGEDKLIIAINNLLDAKLEQITIDFKSIDPKNPDALDEMDQLRKEVYSHLSITPNMNISYKFNKDEISIRFSDIYDFLKYSCDEDFKDNFIAWDDIEKVTKMAARHNPRR